MSREHRPSSLRMDGPSTYLSNTSIRCRIARDARWELAGCCRRITATDASRLGCKSRNETRKRFKFLSCIYIDDRNMTEDRWKWTRTTSSRHASGILKRHAQAAKHTLARAPRHFTEPERMSLIRFRVGRARHRWDYLCFFDQFHGHIVHVFNGLGAGEDFIEKILQNKRQGSSLTRKREERDLRPQFCPSNEVYSLRSEQVPMLPFVAGNSPEYVLLVGRGFQTIDAFPHIE